MTLDDEYYTKRRAKTLENKHHPGAKDSARDCSHGPASPNPAIVCGEQRKVTCRRFRTLLSLHRGICGDGRQIAILREKHGGAALAPTTNLLVYIIYLKEPGRRELLENW